MWSNDNTDLTGLLSNSIMSVALPDLVPVPVLRSLLCTLNSLASSLPSTAQGEASGMWTKAGLQRGCAKTGRDSGRLEPNVGFSHHRSDHTRSVTERWARCLYRVSLCVLPAYPRQAAHTSYHGTGARVSDDTGGDSLWCRLSGRTCHRPPA